MSVVVTILVLFFLGLIGAAGSAEAWSNIRARIRQNKFYKEQYEFAAREREIRGREMQQMQDEIATVRKQLHRERTIDAWSTTAEYEDRIERQQKKIKSQALMIKNLEMELERLRKQFYPDMQ